MPKSKFKESVYPTADVIAAACASYRLTDGIYRKTGHSPTQSPSSVQTLVERLTDGHITDADLEMAAEVGRWWSALVVESLARTLSPLEIDGMNLVDQPTVPHHRLGLAAWLPHGWRRAQAALAVRESLEERGTTTIGTPGVRLDLSVCVSECRWSERWGRAWMTATVQGGGVVRWSAPERLTENSALRIRGTVTKHTVDGRLHITHLNRVKVVEITSSSSTNPT